MTSSKAKMPNYEFQEFIPVVAIVGLIFSGIGIILWQLYHYLRFNEWISLSVVDLLKWCEVKWAFLPTDWLGMYRVLEFAPLSGSLFVAAWIVFLSAKEG